MIFMKFVLSVFGLSDAYTGGLNAYGLSILLVAFLESKNLNKKISNVFF